MTSQQLLSHDSSKHSALLQNRPYLKAVSFATVTNQLVNPSEYFVWIDRKVWNCWKNLQKWELLGFLSFFSPWFGESLVLSFHSCSRKDHTKGRLWISQLEKKLKWLVKSAFWFKILFYPSFQRHSSGSGINCGLLLALVSFFPSLISNDLIISCN